MDDQGTISAEAFAKSIISSVRTSKVDSYLLRIEELELDGRVSYSEYLAFMELL